jgi:hypothetical protein
VTDIMRRVIQVSADQVIGPPRRRRKPTVEPLDSAFWCASITPLWIDEAHPNAPKQYGFGYFDQVAQRLKP